MAGNLYYFEQEATSVYLNLFGPVEIKKPSEDSGDSLECITLKNGILVVHWHYRHHWDEGTRLRRVLMSNGIVYEDFVKVGEYDTEKVKAAFQ